MTVLPASIAKDQRRPRDVAQLLAALVEEEGLGEKLLHTLRRLHREADSISHEIGKAVPTQLRLMGQMGIDFMDEVVRVYPEFPRRELPRTWEAHLPELPPAVRSILENHG